MKEEIPGLIEYTEAKALHAKWLDTRGEIIANALGHEESYEINFSANDLLKYLEYVIESSKEQGIDEPGIRILFGTYDEDKNPSLEKLRTKATVVLVPTVESSADSSCNKTINALNRAHTGWPPIGL
ncbi:MAG TPA: hypothetical protein VK050_10360 [Flavobacteriaceae bacterium]|nr:hypothetical protein [Flavobacteriaceae bacterium]